MANIQKNIEELRKTIPNNVKLVSVTKYHEVEEIKEVYSAGERVFGESRPQELVKKQAVLPKDIEWHFIGSLQTNKVRSIISFVSLIHSVDSVRLLEVINKEAARCGRVVDVLMEVYVACEETKQGWNGDELVDYMESEQFLSLTNVRVRGVMGMASYVSDTEQIRAEFTELKAVFDRLGAGRADFDILSMGMSGDYQIAIEQGSTMIRVGSAIFA